ncbi:hypothetical protein JKP88DRAFT_261763 [Tribonema minus]|uniref:VWFA domain-containing protein n=1 Tax=Tribonema minus TaxID=303371 RepID=A0A835ZKN0_9STRA|nr:hypothetical protein JKP88DRAFT_261763 [Tribonema minus]
MYRAALALWLVVGAARAACTAGPFGVNVCFAVSQSDGADLAKECSFVSKVVNKIVHGTAAAAAYFDGGALGSLAAFDANTAELLVDSTNIVADVKDGCSEELPSRRLWLRELRNATEAQLAPAARLCLDELAAADNTFPSVLVFVSDGPPKDADAAAIKDKATNDGIFVFGIGVDVDTETRDLLKALLPAAPHGVYFGVTGYPQLNNAAVNVAARINDLDNDGTVNSCDACPVAAAAAAAAHPQHVDARRAPHAVPQR